METANTPGVKETLNGLTDTVGPRAETLTPRLTTPVKPVLFRNTIAEADPPALKLLRVGEERESVKLA